MGIISLFVLTKKLSPTPMKESVRDHIWLHRQMEHECSSFCHTFLRYAMEMVAFFQY